MDDRPPTVATRRIQQREIAARAGVSISTVSRVLNNVAGISAALQQRVLAAATELGYQGEPTRRLGQLQNVGLFTSLPAAASLDPFHADVLNGVEAECGRQGIHLNYATLGQTQARTEFVLDRLRQNPVDGLLLMSVDDPGLTRQLLALDLRIVMINVDQRELPVDTFLPDNRYGTLLAMRHLIGHGHRRIAHITWPERRTIRRRYEAYQAALDEAGIAYAPELIVEAPINAENAYEAMKCRLTSGELDFTAVFCANDLAAIGAMRALQEAGLRIPEDVSVVGFDDLTTTAFLSPPLTTVRVERGELGALAVRRLIERAAAPQFTPIRVELACRLIERQSTARARPRRR
jgi:DNA-binding LacI/PurR family transcriptional regulator